MMFDIFNRVSDRTGRLCTKEEFLKTIESREVVDALKKIAATDDHDKQQEWKKELLPVFAFYATYDDHQRLVAKAHPSGLYMMDADEIDDPEGLWNRIKEAVDINEWGIVLAHKTPSTKGLRVVAINQPGYESIKANMEHFASVFPDVEFDMKVKDLARSSFAVCSSYIYYMDLDKLFGEEEIYIKNPGYKGGVNVCGEGVKHSVQGVKEGVNTYGEGVKEGELGTYEKYGEKWFVVQRSQDLFDKKRTVYGDEDLMYHGKDLRQIVMAWFNLNKGGMPQKGARNQGLFECACDLRYITEFNAELMLACLPALLPKEEVRKAISQALGRERLTTIPNRMRNTLRAMLEKKKEEKEDEKTSIYDILKKETYILPTNQLPPIFRQFVDVAPQDFKKAAITALLPMLGTLGSRLRATYIDGVEQSPSFQCEIEAPMASGKSFAVRLDEIVMADLRAKDVEYRKKELEYNRKVQAAINKKEQPEVETYPIRILNPTTSVSALLERQMNAGEVHLYSFTDEIKVVLDSMKRGSFGDLRALMRNAFDNQYFGQDYKGSKATNAMVKIYFNTLHCGTPAEYKKFYDNSEDGTISRILFAELPDQSFKDLPRWDWEKYDTKYAGLVRDYVRKLSEVTMKHDGMMPVYIFNNFGFMNEWAEKWLKRMQTLAKRENNRSLDTFRRRAAVVGFRAGMLAWFLYGKNNKVNRERTVAFAEMIAEQMLVSLLHRFHVSEVSNVIYFKNVWNRLADEFTADELDEVKEEISVKTVTRSILFRWKEQNLIEKIGDNKYKKKEL